MKRLITICCTVLLAGIMTAALVACSEPAEEHKHTITLWKLWKRPVRKTGILPIMSVPGAARHLPMKRGTMRSHMSRQ